MRRWWWLLAASSVGCFDPERDQVAVEPVAFAIDLGEPAGELDERYVGVAFDTAQFTGGKWWKAGVIERQFAETPDLESTKLRTLTAALGPALIRVGGTDCDAVYFCPDEGECELPPAYQDTFDSDDRREGVLTHEDLRRTADFAEAVGAEVLFCVNMGLGPRDPDTGAWRGDNARELIQFATSLPNGDVFTGWEPGNEMNVATFHFSMPDDYGPDTFADDVVELGRVVAEEAPGARLVAPGSYITPFGEAPLFTAPLMENLAARPVDPVDVVSWHLYATQSESCPGRIDLSTPEVLVSPALEAQHRGHARLIAESAGGRPVWNTESASAQCGGQEGFSDRMVDAIWQMDWFGILAEEGTSLIVRHSLVGADYSLLAPDSFEPRPGFLALAWMRRLARGAHFRADVDRTQLWAHAYCGVDHDLAVILANPYEVSRRASVDLGSTIVGATRWSLTSNGGALGTSAFIDGFPIGDDGALPDAPGTPLSPRGTGLEVDVAASSVTYLAVDLDVPPAACE